MTRLSIERELADADRLLAHPPETWLPGDARAAGPDRWAVDLRLGPFRRRVTMIVAPLFHDGPSVGRPLTWEVAPQDSDALPWARILPPFHGVLTGTHDRLALRGSYAPPAAGLGRVVDLWLRRLARRSLRTLVDDIRVGASTPPRATTGGRR